MLRKVARGAAPPSPLVSITIRTALGVEAPLTTDLRSRLARELEAQRTQLPL